jgi:hypothetical protein
MHRNSSKPVRSDAKPQVWRSLRWVRQERAAVLAREHYSKSMLEQERKSQEWELGRPELGRPELGRPELGRLLRRRRRQVGSYFSVCS